MRQPLLGDNQLVNGVASRLGHLNGYSAAVQRDRWHGLFNKPFKMLERDSAG